MSNRAVAVVLALLALVVPANVLADDGEPADPAVELCADKRDADTCAEELGICLDNEDGELACRMICIIDAFGTPEVPDHPGCPEWATTCVSELGGQVGFCAPAD